MPWSSASYSASLLEALLKLIWRTYLSFVPLGETTTTHAPAPCCRPVEEPGQVWGAWCLDLCPLDQEIWEYLGLDCCRMLELQVPRAELDVPLGDSTSRTGVIEYVREWRTAHDCYRAFVEIVRHLS